MNSKLIMTRSMLALLILMPLLTGCVGARTTIEGPRLGYPPPKTVDALETVARADPDSAAWVIDLDRYYSKLEITAR